MDRSIALTSAVDSLTTTSYTEPSQTLFSPFPRLPTELRLKIWNATLPGPRVIKIVRSSYPKAGPRPITPLCRAIEPLDGLKILHVCQESCTIVQEVFSIISINRGLNLEYPFFIDPSSDMLHFEDLTTLTFFVAPTFRHRGKNDTIQRIAIDIDISFETKFMLARQVSEKVARLCDATATFRNLKECIVVIPDNQRDPFCDFMRILKRHVRKLKEGNQEFYEKQFGKGVGNSNTPLGFPEFTRMDKIQFELVGQVVRKYWS